MRPSLLNQEINAKKLLDNKSATGLKQDENFNDLVANKLSDLLTTEAKNLSNTKKLEKKALQLDAAKQTNLLDKIFDYIYIAKCKKLFLLA